jgi:hypothetical protein
MLGVRELNFQSMKAALALVLVRFSTAQILFYYLKVIKNGNVLTDECALKPALGGIRLRGFFWGFHKRSNKLSPLHNSYLAAV